MLPDRFKNLFTSTVVRILKENQPQKRKTAFSFYYNDAIQINTKTNNKLGPKKLYQQWLNSPLSEKLFYYRKQTIDDLRFKRQNPVWATQVASICYIHSEDYEKFLNELKNLAENEKHIRSENDIEEILKKRWGNLIEYQSAKILVDDMKKFNNNNQIILQSDHSFEHLACPTKAASPFVYFLQDFHRENDRKDVEHNGDSSLLINKDKFAHVRQAGLIWKELPDEVKQRYYDMFEKGNSNYKKALEVFYNESPRSHDFLKIVSKEKRSFSHSLRHALRKFMGVPIITRGPHIHYAMDCCKIKSNIPLKKYVANWFELSEQEKEPYIKLFKEDRTRYLREVNEYKNLYSYVINIGREKGNLKSK